tara:strand:- start:65 stop:436 length:372 start_codon:yes stop_codon:yes gene_type:complete
MGWKFRVFWQRLKFRLLKRRGAKGEKIAAGLLSKNGYRILDTQISLKGSILVDEKPINFTTRVDYLVEKDGQEYLVEVKTGASASPSNIPTRRQLLEYTRLYHSDKILLIDASRKTIVRIDFP